MVKPLHTAYTGNSKELLTKIIKTAKAAGFTFNNFLDRYDSFIITTFNVDTGRMVFVLRNEEQLRVVYDSIYNLFFDLNFARALFGSDWEKHLVELAKSPDKLFYISENNKNNLYYDNKNNKIETA